MLTKTPDGQNKDVSIFNVTKENYIVPEKAKHVYHCLIEVKKFNADTGARLSRPRLQTFGKKTFAAVAQSLRNQGYTITVLYDPTEYLESIKAELAKGNNPVQMQVNEAVAAALEEKRKKEIKEEAQRKAEFDKAVAEAVAAELAKREAAKEEKPEEAEQPTEEPAAEAPQEEAAAEAPKRGRKARGEKEPTSGEN